MTDRFVQFRSLFDAFSGAGYSIYVVGGCVRDIVMGLDRVGDVDLATDAHPEQIRSILEDAGFKAYPIGERFGTITTVVGDDTVEITTFRVGEIYEPGSRHPKVEFGTDLVADLSRRDLSMNAMALDPDGTIVDPFDGRRAIAERTLEVPGGGYENTLSILRDDPLRLLRIARFAARFGFTPTADTTAAARASATDLLHISRERWKMELDKLLMGEHVAVGLRWLGHVGALSVVLPDADVLDAEAVERLALRIADAPTDTITRWAVLLATCAEHAPVPSAGASIGASELARRAAEVARELKFSNRERRALTNTLAWWPNPGAALAHWSDADLRRAFVSAPEDIRAQLALVRALADGDSAARDAADVAEARLDAILATGDPTPALPPQFGKHVRGRLGLGGAAIGDAIDAVRDAILDGELPNGAGADAYIAFLQRRGFGTDPSDG